MTIDPARILETERKTLRLQPDILPEGSRILDVGGGGEGVISALYGEKVVAIDIRLEELLELGRSPSKKAVMDAANLACAAGWFDRASAFFTLMYLDAEEICRVFAEVHRLLKVGGIFEIWDIEMPSRDEVEKDVFIAQLAVETPNETFTPGYGVGLRSACQDMGWLSAKLRNAGFKLVRSELQVNGLIYLRADK